MWQLVVKAVQRRQLGRGTSRRKDRGTKRIGSKVQEGSDEEGSAGGSRGEEREVGFDNLFFQHEVTSATAVSERAV